MHDIVNMPIQCTMPITDCMHDIDNMTMHNILEKQQTTSTNPIDSGKELLHKASLSHSQAYSGILSPPT